MNVIVASFRKSAGKTSFIVGLAHMHRIGYMKPFGDRLLYRKKRLWDYDAALFANVFGLDADPENITIAFEHAKVRYMYKEEDLRKHLLDMADKAGKGKEVLVVEGGKDLTYGSSVHLDALSVAKYIGGRLVLVVSGDSEAVLDDLQFVKKYVSIPSDMSVIVNKVRDVGEFKDVYAERVREMGVHLVGIIPYEVGLTYHTVGYVSEFLFAKVLAGEKGLNNVVKHVFVGALSAGEALRNPLFEKEGKLIITGGDRTDMVLAALESDTAGIVLTNGILPPSSIVAKAEEKNVPLLSVSFDTHHTARQVDGMEPLLTKNDAEKIRLLQNLVREHVSVKELLEG